MKGRLALMGVAAVAMAVASVAQPGNAASAPRVAPSGIPASAGLGPDIPGATCTDTGDSWVVPAGYAASDSSDVPGGPGVVHSNVPDCVVSGSLASAQINASVVSHGGRPVNFITEPDGSQIPSPNP